MKLSPQVENLTAAARTWAACANAVKSIDDVAVLEVAEPNTLRVWRHFEANQDTSDPEGRVDRAVAALGGYRHPLLVLEPFNEEHPTAEQMRRAVVHAHALGFLIAVGSWGRGDFTQADWDAAVASRPDFLSCHGYWSYQVGPTQWNAYRWRQFWKPGQPKILVTECGIDTVRDGPNGTYIGLPAWKSNRLSAEEYLASVLGYGAAIDADPSVAFSFLVVCGPTDRWTNFDSDPIAAQLAARTSQSSPHGGPMILIAPWKGNGAWIWYESYDGDAAAVKLADGATFGDATNATIFKAQFDDLCAKLRAAGIRVLAFVYDYLADPVGEANRAAYAQAAGADGIVFDVEYEAIGRFAQADQFFAELRAKGDTTITHRNPDEHSRAPVSRPTKSPDGHTCSSIPRTHSGSVGGEGWNASRGPLENRKWRIPNLTRRCVHTLVGPGLSRILLVSTRCV